MRRLPSECLAQYPGGLCDEPTGTDNCTFHVEDAGTVTLDELSGRNASQSLQDWCAAGNLEWDPATDRGVGMNFWNGLHNDPLRKERMYKLGYLFWKKYPSFPKRLSDPRGCRVRACSSLAIAVTDECLTTLDSALATHLSSGRRVAVRGGCLRTASKHNFVVNFHGPPGRLSS